MLRVLVTFVPGLVAGCVGGALGYFAYQWIMQQGFFALVLPGALAGLACGFCSVDHSKIRGLICAVIALGAGFLSYWLTFTPGFETDGSFIDLITKSYQLNRLTQIMIVLGAFLGFWWGRETTNPWRHRFALGEGKASAKADQPVIDE